MFLWSFDVGSSGHVSCTMTICHTVSVDSPHDLHMHWCLSCLIHAVLDRICSYSLFLSSEDQALCFLLQKAILEPSQARTPFQPHLKFAKQTLLVGLFPSSCLVSPLSFSSCSPEDSLLHWTSTFSFNTICCIYWPCYSSGSHARICTPP